MSDEKDPFAGLMRGRTLNPALKLPDDAPPSQMSQMPVGYISADEIPTQLNVKIVKRLRTLARRNAGTRGMTLTEYISFLIEHDSQ